MNDSPFKGLSTLDARDSYHPDPTYAIARECLCAIQHFAQQALDILDPGVFVHNTASRHAWRTLMEELDELNETYLEQFIKLHNLRHPNEPLSLQSVKRVHEKLAAGEISPEEQVDILHTMRALR